MKTTLYLKRIDLTIQVGLLLMIVACFILRPHHYETEYMERMYKVFGVLGSYQMVSCLLNKFLLGKEMKISGRWLYEAFLLIAVIILGMLLLVEEFGSRSLSLGLLLLFMVFFVNLLMAIWYCAISILEILNLSKRIKKLTL